MVSSPMFRAGLISLMAPGVASLSTPGELEIEQHRLKKVLIISKSPSKKSAKTARSTPWKVSWAYWG